VSQAQARTDFLFPEPMVCGPEDRVLHLLQDRLERPGKDYAGHRTIDNLVTTVGNKMKLAMPVPIVDRAEMFFECAMRGF
jgi:hypothetical protein